MHRRARRRGLGAALVRAVEAAARDAGKALLLLDTDGYDPANPSAVTISNNDFANRR